MGELFLAYDVADQPVASYSASGLLGRQIIIDCCRAEQPRNIDLKSYVITISNIDKTNSNDKMMIEFLRDLVKLHDEGVRIRFRKTL